MLKVLRRIYLGLCLMLLMHMGAISSFAQCPAPNFTSPATVCRDQRVFFEPTSSFSTYEWDLCSGELEGTPTATVLNKNFGGYGFKVELVEQNGSYFGFFLSRGTNKLWRLDFGASINNTPLLVDLGGLGKSSGTWRVIEVVKEGSNYFGFIIDESLIYRISFGNSLSNTPTAAETLLTGNPVNLPIDMVAVEEGASKYLFVVNRGNSDVVRVKFNSAWSDATAQLSVSTFQAAIPRTHSGLTMMKDCGKWYAIASSIEIGGLYKFAFNAGLDDPAPVSSLYSAPYSPAGIQLIKDNNKYYAFLQSENPGKAVVRVDFRSTLANDIDASNFTPFTNIGYGTSGLWGFSMYKVKSDIVAFSAENSDANLYKITFPQTCFSDITWSTEANPVITSKNAGSFNVTLDVTNGSGVHGSIARPITVTANAAPDINFTSTNICAGQNVNFTSTSVAGGITSYNWDFGDSGSASTANPSHTYAQGSYTVDLTVASSATGCSNAVVRPIKIYTAPVADFQLPTGLICTNNQFTFVNQIPDVYDGNLTYQWSVDGVAASTTRDLQYAFTGTGDRVVRLVGSIPGCSDQEEKTLVGVLPGAQAAYTIAGQCQNNTITFTNGSSGPITSYAWNFGNGQTSTTTNATSTYATPGPYQVTMQAFATNGCITTVKKDLTIYSLPAPAFTLDLPPFSCARTPSQFHDATPTPTDSNVQSWAWTFGDTGTGAGKDPTHIYQQGGSYTVQLTATTEKGCSASASQQVSIAESPVASFATNPPCASQATNFDDTSTGSIKTWQWKIGNSNYSLQEPTHVFLSPGTYSAQLTVTGNNNCVSTLTKSLVVPVIPAVDFRVTNACAGQDAVFTDITTTPDDPTVQRTWTFNGTSTANGATALHAFTTAASYPVELRIQNQSGCVYSTSRQVTINVTPVVDFTMNPESGPPPLEVKFTGTATNATTYSWNFNDGKPGSTVLQPTHVFDQLGQYAVDFTATSLAGCASTTSKTVNVIVPVSELALLDIKLQATDNTLTTYTPLITLRNNGNYNIRTVVIYYEIGAGLRIRETLALPGEAGLAPATSGIFMLTNQIRTGDVFSGYLCAELESDTDDSNNKACMTIGNEPTLFSPYPNPAISTVNVEVINSQANDVHIRIFDTKGDIALDKTLDGGAGLSTYSIDVQNLGPGIYVMLITSGGQTLSRRISIVR